MTQARLLARTFGHGALGDRVIVRLVQDSLEPAVDVEMSVLGFSPPAHASVDVGETPRRALGFPTWALVNRPDEARFALDVMRSFRKTAARVKTKPGHARDGFVEIADTLARTVPAFLPSFWEEAARTYLAEEATAFAAQCFEKAREAERAYGLAIDEDHRAGAYLEFALAGAVPAKSLAGYADELVKAYGAAEALTRFRVLNVHRIFAGLPPFAGLGKVLRRLAKQAGTSEREGDEIFVREIIGAPALARAGNDFWSTYLPTLTRLGGTNEAIRDRLLWLFPRTKGHATFADEWLAMVQTLDAVAHVAAAGRAGEWLEKLIGFVAFRGDAPADTPTPARFFTLLEAIAPRLRGGDPVIVANGRTNAHQPDWFLLDVLEAALALEVPIAAPRAGTYQEASIDLGRRFSRDPQKIAAHEAFGPMLDAAVMRAFGGTAFETWAAEKPALRASRERAFGALVDDLSRGGLHTFETTLSALEDKLTPALAAELPEPAKRLAATRVEASLARTLRAGLFDELAFPAYEELLRELAPKARRDLDLFGSMAHPIVCQGPRVFVFDGRERQAERSMPADAVGSAHALALIDGDLLVEYRTKQSVTVLAWTSAPQSPMAGGLTYALRDVFPTPLPTPGGGDFLGTTPVHRGDHVKSETIRGYLTDGTTFWRKEATYEGGGTRMKLNEIDPQTGKVGRPSWPSFALEASEKTDGLVISDIALAKLPSGVDGAILGAVDGFIGAIGRRRGNTAFEHIRLDGKTRKGRYLTAGMVSLPGTDVGLRLAPGWSPNIEDRFYFVDEEGYTTLEVGHSGVPSVAFSRLPRHTWLPLLSVRHAPSSLALRAVTDDAAEAILRAAAGELAPGETKDDVHACTPVATPLTDAATRAALPGVTDPVLVTSVGQIARAAARLGRRHEALAALSVGADSTRGPDDDAVKKALFLASPRGWGDGDVVADLVATAAFFAGEPATTLTGSTIGFHAVCELWPKLLCFLTSRAELPAEDRATTASLLKGLVVSGLLGRALTRATLKVEQGKALLARANDARSWLTEIEGRRYFVRLLDDFRDPQLGRVEVITPTNGPYSAPAHATLEHTEDIVVPDATAFIAGFFDELRARGPAKLDPLVARAAIVPEVLDEGFALFLLAGFPKGAGPAYAHDFLGKAVREAIGLRVKDAAAAKARVDELAKGPNKAFFARALDVPSPAGFWADADDPQGLAATVAKAARETFGDEQAVSGELLVTLDKMLRTGLPARDLLTLLFEDAAPVLQVRESYPVDQLHQQRPGFTESVVVSFAILVPWLLSTCTLADPLVQALPAGYRRVREALSHPGVLFGLGTASADGPGRLKLVEQVGGTPGKYLVYPALPEVEGRDNGLAVAIDDARYTVRFAFRPARVPDDPEALRRLIPLTWDGDVGGRLPGNATLFLLSSACVALIDEVARLSAKGPPAPTASLSDPRVSAPETVASITKARGLSEDAATLYLQILALPQPTQKNVCGWNDWAAPRYKAAANELAAAPGLVVFGKRERAGRELFLPGGWEKLAGVHIESWKHALYTVLGGAPVVAEPYGALFARTYARSLTEDGPRFEDTATVIAAGRKKGKAK